MGLCILTCEGNITKDPEMRTTTSGANICGFTVAVNKMVKGEKRTTFIRCDAFGKLGETLHRYTKKGHSISVSGDFEIRTWKDKEGVERQTPQVNVNSFSFGAKPKSDQGQEAPEEF